MGVSYAVSWQEWGVPADFGRLEMHPESILFVGASGRRRVAFDELSLVRVSRSPEERLAGRPTLVLERRGAGAIRVASLDRAGVVLELAEQLAVAAGG